MKTVPFEILVIRWRLAYCHRCIKLGWENITSFIKPPMMFTYDQSKPTDRITTPLNWQSCQFDTDPAIYPHLDRINIRKIVKT